MWIRLHLIELVIAVAPYTVKDVIVLCDNAKRFIGIDRGAILDSLLVLSGPPEFNLHVFPRLFVWTGSGR